jgi:hypothetical protein
MLTSDTVLRYIEDNDPGNTGTWLIKDTGSGNEIVTWDMGALAEPTAGQLASIATTMADEEKAAEERAWRDAELIDTDMFGLSDQTMTTAMETYRQDLRDMPAQAGFPNSHTRPTRP